MPKNQTHTENIANVATFLKSLLKNANGATNLSAAPYDEFLKVKHNSAGKARMLAEITLGSHPDAVLDNEVVGIMLYSSFINLL